MKYLILRSFIFLLAFTCFNGQSKAAEKTVILTDTLDDFWVVREYVDFFVDTSRTLTITEVDAIYKAGTGFQISTAADLINEDISSAYWLRFEISDQNQERKEFSLEIFDHDIDEVTFYTPLADGTFKRHHSGAGQKFNTRQLKHKNVGFIIPEIPEENKVFYMRFYSTKLNVLEPGIRSLQDVFNYSIKEYLFIGVFYGTLLLVILYNLIYYVILRQSHYLYYVIYTSVTFLYLTQKDGTGFQFLWPNYPELSNLISLSCLALGTIAMYLFYIRFLAIPKGSKIHSFLFIAIGIRIIVFAFQVAVYNSVFLLLIDYLYAQIIYVIGWRFWLKERLPAAKWFVLSYSFFNASITISLLERAFVIPSGIATVYSVNVGILAQFILLTIGIAETVKEVYKARIDTKKRLIEEYKRNEVLKGKVQRELEEKVQERTCELENAKNEIEEQSQKIKLINRDLDIANYQLRKNMTSFVKETVNKHLLSFKDFQQAYPDDFACKRMLLKLKENKGFECKQCGSQKSIKGKADYDLRCSKCNYNESLTANTIFHRSRFPLLSGFYMFYSLTQSRDTISATELSEILELNVTTCQKFKQKVQERIAQKEYKNCSWEKMILNKTSN